MLSLPAVAKELNLSHTTTWRLVQSGKLKARKVGNSYVTTRTALEAFKQLDRKPGRPPKQKSN